MKRLFSIFSAVVLLAGCTNFEEMQQPNVGGEQNYEVPQCVYSSLTEEDSRTYLVQDKNILWQKGDAISYFAPLFRAQYSYNGENDSASAIMELAGETINHSRILFTHALYPYDKNATCSFVDNEHHISVNFPTEQHYATKSFGKGANVMVAAGTVPNETENNLYFRSVCGFFVIQLYGDNVAVKSVKLTSLGGERISGAATLAITNDGEQQITMSNDSSNAITLNCYNNGEYVAISNNKEQPTEFWIALPPTTFEQGLKIEVTDTNNKVFKKETSKQIVIERNKIKPMAALKFVQTQPDNTMWYTLHSGSTSKFDWVLGQAPFNAAIKNHYYDPENKRFVVEFSGSLTTIKAEAFDDVYDLGSIALPKTVTHIEDAAFRNCINLASVEMHGSVKTIGQYAFKGCTALKSITIPGSVESIGDHAFYGCSSLNTVRIEDADTPLNLGLSHTGYYITTKRGPFYTSPLANIYLGRDIQLMKEGEAISPASWDEGAFANEFYSDSDITATVSIGPKVESINDYMFSGVRLKYLYIYPTIKRIGFRAFYDCRLFQGISSNHTTPPALDKTAFEACNEMWYIKVPKEAMTAFKSSEGWKDFDKNNKYGHNFFYEME